MGYSLSYPFVLPCGNFIVELLGSESMLNCMKRRINFIPRSRSAERSEFIISSRVTRARSTWTACGSKRGANSQLSSLLVYIRWCPPWRHTVVWRHGAFLFLGNIRLKAISNSHQWPKYSWRAVFPSSAKQCLLSANLKPFLMRTEQQTQEHRIVNPRRGTFHTEKSSGARTPTSNSTAQATKMETAATNSGAEGTSLNEFRMLKYFKSKWKRFWIISLNIWANIAVTKHVLLADEFIPYRPRLLGFHSLHVNAMKCIYVYGDCLISGWIVNCNNNRTKWILSNSEARERGAPYLRKFGKLSIRENLVMTSPYVRTDSPGRVK